MGCNICGYIVPSQYQSTPKSPIPIGLIWLLRGIKCQKLGFFDIFSETSYQNFQIYCMIVEGNRVPHFGMVPYLGKILIRDYVGD